MFKSKWTFFLMACLFLSLVSLNLENTALAKGKGAKIVTKIKNVGSGPDNLAFAPDGTHLFVSGVGPLFFIDTAKNVSLGEFQSLVGGQDPKGTDPSTLVFAKRGSENLSFATNFVGHVAVVDVSILPSNKGRLIASGSNEKGLVGGIISSDGTTLFAINKLAPRISLFPIFKDPVLNVSEVSTNNGFINNLGTGSSDIVASPDGKLAYVADSISQDIAIVNLTTKKLVKKIFLTAIPMKIALSPKGDRLYVTLNNTGQLAVIDTTTDQILSIISQIGEGTWGITLNSTGSRAYITNNISGDLTILNTTNNKIIQKIPKIGLQPRGLTLSPKGDKLYIANFFSQSVTVVSLKNAD